MNANGVSAVSRLQKFRLILARSGLEGLCITFSVGCIHVSTYKAREPKVSPSGIPPGR